MKHLYVSKIAMLCVFILQIIGLQAQNYSCEDRLFIAEKLLDQDSISQELIKEISTSLDSCTAQNASSFYVKGLLKLKVTSNVYLKEGFQDIETAALSGHEKAALTLGLLYKDGIGCKIDFDKAKYWFETSANMGNDRAAYSLGYFYLKGLGTLQQDYTKAVSWFKKSRYPMARHWLAVCEYYGFGIPQNQSLALSKLKENKILNSQTVATEFRSNDSLSPAVSSLKTSNPTQAPVLDSDLIPIMYDLSLTGTFYGQYMEYDWSGQYLLRVLPIEISLNEEKNTFKIVIKDQELSGKAVFDQNKISFENAELIFDKLYTDHPDQQKLPIEFLNVSFMEAKNSDKKMVIGVVDSWVEQWQEPGPPIRFVFDNIQLITKEARNNLEQQQDNFIQLYPNPFQDQLVIEYELEEDAQIHAVLYAFTGAPIAIISKEQTQQKGSQLLQYNGSHLNPGKYIIQLWVDGKVYSKLLIKN